MTQKKNHKVSYQDTIRICLGLIFAAAAIGRIIFFQSGIAEFAGFGLGAHTLLLTIVVELITSLLLLCNKYVRVAAGLLILLMLFGLALVIPEMNWSEIASIFSITASPADIFLHVLYLALLVLLCYNYSQKDPQKK